MAKKQVRPGRTLVVFLLGVAIAYGLVALTGTWKPELGLDLQGGTRITLQAKGNPSGSALDEAREIIDKRVNGSGVNEADVITQGGDVIVVEIPGERRRDLIEVVERQAQLRFRLVACSDAGGGCAVTATTPVPETDPSTTPSATTSETPPATSSSAPTGGPSSAPTTKSTKTPGAGATSSANPRVAPGFGRDTTTPTADPTDSTSAEPTETPTTAPTDPATTAPTESAPADPTATDTEVADPNAGFDQNAVSTLDKELAFIRTGVTQADVDLFNSYGCGENGNLIDADGPATLPDNPLAPLVACSPPEKNSDDEITQPTVKYLLSQAIIEGTDLSDADYGIPTGDVQYAVTLELKNGGREVFNQASVDLTRDVEQFAVVLDGQVLSAPTFQGTITGGSAQITGNFTETQAKNLSTSLKFGALPISFEDPSSETIGPSLAGDQLTAGLTAGAFGLGLVLLYCLIYYRGLGSVVVASLLMASVVTYALVLLLSKGIGFTLTLPGIAGLIIAVGITADSFIIFFERIRDEMREGKSMRVAVESGWKRAKVTRLAAQVVSLLSAVVLYIFATGAVKGFGFALGLTTLVDLAILFWFTKPMVSWLAQFTFFNSGHRLSGLSASSLGIDEPTGPSVAGGKA